MSLTLDRSARLAGQHHWMETRLFEIVGGWVPSTAEAEAKLMFDRHSQHHAWRAAQWWDRLPFLADVHRDTLSRPGSPGVEAAIDRLTGLDTTVGRLTAAYRFALPRLWAAYERHRADADPVADASSLRAIAIVGPDATRDWQEGEVMLHSLLTAPEPVEEAAATLAGLEAAVLGSGR